jgi:MoaA/NifB/PqqE/SkfB family radical SAM enzyme
MVGFFDVLKQPPVAEGEPYPLFNRVSIETSKHCNRECPFCPCSRGERHEVYHMDPGLFAKVVTDLGELRFDGVIQAFLLNEPLLDRHFLDRLAAMREACPGATVYVSTNADALGRDPARAAEKLCQYYEAGMNVANLNVYDLGEAGRAQAERFAEMVRVLTEHYGVRVTENKYRRHNPRRNYVAVSDMRTDREDAAAPSFDQFHSRGMGEDRETLQAYCARPHRHLVIEHDGNVPICCAIDPTDRTLPSVGNVSEVSLLDLWNSPILHAYRWMLQQRRRELPGCVGCNHRMSYPHVVRKVSVTDETREAIERKASRNIKLKVVTP